MPLPHDRRKVILPSPGDIYADNHAYPHQLFIVLAINKIGSDHFVYGYCITNKKLSYKNPFSYLIASPFVQYDQDTFLKTFPYIMTAFDDPTIFGFGKIHQHIDYANFPFLRTPPQSAAYFIWSKLKGVFTTKRDQD